MQNRDIDEFFADSGLAELDLVERMERPPNVVWQFQALGFPMFIQTQESVDRMRIVAFIADAGELGAEQLTTLMEANYHSALDARYALTDGNLVSLFLHPLEELSLAGFISGMYQTIHTAHTCGTSFSGGTLVFGSAAADDDRPGGDGASLADSGRDMYSEVVQMIRSSGEE